MQVYHLGVKFALLHGEIKEDIYVEQSSGFEGPGKEDLAEHKTGCKSLNGRLFFKCDGQLLFCCPQNQICIRSTIMPRD